MCQNTLFPNNNGALKQLLPLQCKDVIKCASNEKQVNCSN